MPFIPFIPPDALSCRAAPASPPTPPTPQIFCTFSSAPGGSFSTFSPHSPARVVLAPVETGEELLLVSPAREVRLEWKVGRFSLLPAEGVTLGGSTHRTSFSCHLHPDRPRSQPRSHPQQKSGHLRNPHLNGQGRHKLLFQWFIKGKSPNAENLEGNGSL